MMQRTARHARRSIAMLALLALVAQSALGDTIILKRAVRMPADRDSIMLADVATLEGEAAQALADVVVYTADDPTLMQEVTIESIREALREADVHWGKVHLRGGDVMVRPRPNLARSLPEAMRPVSIRADRTPTERDTRPENPTVTASSLVEAPTVRGEIARRIAQGMQAAPERLRMMFDRADDELLDTALDGFGVEIDPMSSFTSDRMEIAVRFWKNGRTVREETVTVHPEIRAPAAVLARDMSRGEQVFADDLEEQVDWRKPSELRLLAHRVEAAGRVLTRSMRQGEVLRSRDVERETVIERGDRITVRCLSGGIVITMQAEARADAAIGEEVELRKVGDRVTFFATVTAPGECVLDLQKH